MYNTKRQKNMIIGGLLAIVCIMAIGYAAFASNLNISGSGAVSSNWSVKITDIASKNIVGTAGNKSTPTYADTTATFTTTLQSPGDSITYDITVSNEGSLDAKLDNITLSNSNNPAITFETSGLAKGSALYKNESTVLTIKVTYNNSVTSQPDTLTANLKVTLDFVQAGVGDNGIAVPTSKITMAGKQIAVVSNGDGLYMDYVTPGRYFYRGTNVDNYITFNDETWRIMSVENDGTLKIIRNEQLSSTQKWDASGTRNSSTSTYCTNASKYGCNAWAATTNLVETPSVFTQYYNLGNPTNYTETYTGTVTGDASLNTYLNGTYYNSLSGAAQAKVVTGIFNVSTPGNAGGTETLEVDAEQEKQYQWQGKVALMTATELLRTSTSSGCTSLSAGYNSESSSVCSSNNWLWPTFNTNLWEMTLSPLVSSARNAVWVVSHTGFAGGDWANNFHGFRPVLHLSSSITLSGSGTSSDPYTIN